MLGFTRNELRVVFFLIFSLLVGMGLRLYKGGVHQNLPVASSDSAFETKFKARAADINLADKQRDSDASAKRVSVALPRRNSSNVEHALGDGLLIDVNTATVSELERLPKVGPVLARKIVDYRDEHGSFRHIRDLVKVKGIGEATLRRLKPLLVPIE